MVDLLRVHPCVAVPAPAEAGRRAPEGSPLNENRDSSPSFPPEFVSRVALVCGIRGSARKRKRHAAFLDTSGGRSVYSPPMTSDPHAYGWIVVLGLGLRGRTA